MFGVGGSCKLRILCAHFPCGKNVIKICFQKRHHYTICITLQVSCYSNDQDSYERYWILSCYNCCGVVRETTSYLQLLQLHVASILSV